jgi:ABC-type transport system substrate-binding protein
MNRLFMGVLATCLAAVILLSSGAMSVKPAQATSAYGPRIDQLLCKIYPDGNSEFTAFQAGQVDIIDWPLTKTLVPVINSTSGYALDKFRQFNMFEFDLNNNDTVISYPGVKIPTSDANFRIAMAYMVDKPYTVSTILGGYGVVLDAPLMSWLPWYDPLMTTYSYNATAACTILCNNGWRSSPDPNVATNVHFPASWPTLPGGPVVAGQDLITVFNKTDIGFGAGSGPGIIFIRIPEAPYRSAVGQLLIYGDSTHKGLKDIGIPVNDFNVQRRITQPHVYYEKNFMVYTGGWSLSRNPDYVYDLYNPNPIDYNPLPYIFAENYDHVNDPTLNMAEVNIKFAKDLSTVLTSCHTFCDRWGQIEPTIPLWASAGYYAHITNVHVLNVESYGIPDWWNLYCMNVPSVGVTGGTVNMGFASDVQMLNVISSQWVWDWQVLSEVYDTLIRFNPVHVGVDVPWMASSWTVGSWNVPSGLNAGGIGTTITYTLNSGINFVNPVTGTVYGTVTPDDVAFSLQYTYGQADWNAPALSDCFTNATTAAWAVNAGYQIPFVTTTSNTITVYFQHQSAWAVDWAGSIPIIPKAIFNTINDASGFYPGGDANVQAMTGSGPYYFSSYTTGTSCLLLANRNFFKPIVPNKDTDPTHIHIDWGIFRCKAVPPPPWKVIVLDLIVVATSLGAVGPYGGWIPGDVNCDGKVNVLDLILIASCLGAHWDC